jgi:hypothetical protein
MIALALSFLALVSATPLEKRAPNCRPNFGGPPGLSIINAGSSVEWSLASSPPVTGTKIVSRAANIGDNEFRVEFTGQPTNTYLIKPVNFPDLRVAASQGEDLHITTPDLADATQSWNILCNQCGAPIGGTTFTTGCTIQSAAGNNQCVQTGATTGSTFKLADCTGGANQLYNFAASNS